MKSAVEQAKQLVEQGQLKKAWDLVSDEILKGSIEALFLSSHFDVESGTTNSLGKIDVLLKCAVHNHPAALYELACHYEFGEEVSSDKLLAEYFFTLAFIHNHPHALWQRGQQHLYGSHGFPKDEKLGILLIKKSAELKSQGALRSLAAYYSSGDFGFPVDMEEAKKMQIASEADDVLEL